MLKIKNLEVNYGHIQALNGISLEVAEGQLISIIGSNGAGKTTLLNTISGLVKAKCGEILYKGITLPREPHIVVRKGIVQVPEGRRIFGGLSVRENLIIGGYLIKNKNEINRKINEMFELFPVLRERKNQHAETLSGGEQQMLTISRGLMSNPDIVLLDEPSLGLSPILVNEVFKLIENIREMGITILLVEQNSKKALALCDYAYVLENGKISLEGKGNELLCNDDIKKSYLGDKK